LFDALSQEDHLAGQLLVGLRGQTLPFGRDESVLEVVEDLLEVGGHADDSVDGVVQVFEVVFDAPNEDVDPFDFLFEHHRSELEAWIFVVLYGVVDLVFHLVELLGSLQLGVDIQQGLLHLGVHVVDVAVGLVAGLHHQDGQQDPVRGVSIVDDFCVDVEAEDRGRILSRDGVLDELLLLVDGGQVGDHLLLGALLVDLEEERFALVEHEVAHVFV